MIAMATQRSGVPMDDGDDLLPLRRRRDGIPEFPWRGLRFLMTRGGAYAPNTRMQPVPTSTRNLTGIRWGPIFESAEYGPIATAVDRAFIENRKRHNLRPIHMTILMYCEIGMVERPDTKGILRWCLYRPERSDAVMPYEEAARLLAIRADLVERYHNDTRRAITDEWVYLHSGYEG